MDKTNIKHVILDLLWSVTWLLSRKVSKLCTFYVNLIVNPIHVNGKYSWQNVHSKPIVNLRTHREYPQEGGRLDDKRH